MRKEIARSNGETEFSNPRSAAPRSLVTRKHLCVDVERQMALTGAGALYDIDQETEMLSADVRAAACSSAFAVQSESKDSSE